MSVTALVLAAGGSHRLGRPKQLLPVGDGTLLDATLSTVRRCGLDQVVVAVGGSALAAGIWFASRRNPVSALNVNDAPVPRSSDRARAAA